MVWLVLAVFDGRLPHRIWHIGRVAENPKNEYVIDHSELVLDSAYTRPSSQLYRSILRGWFRDWFVSVRILPDIQGWYFRLWFANDRWILVSYEMPPLWILALQKWHSNAGTLFWQPVAISHSYPPSAFVFTRYAGVATLCRNMTFITFRGDTSTYRARGPCQKNSAWSHPFGFSLCNLQYWQQYRV